MAQAPQVTNSTTSSPGSLNGYMSDQTVQKAAYLGATSLAQDIIKGKSLEFKKAAVLAGADYLALKYATDYFSGPLQSFTKETFWSGMAAEAIALTATLFVGNKVGIINASSVEGALVDSPNLGSGKVAGMVESIVEAGILLGERQAALFVGQKLGVLQ